MFEAFSNAAPNRDDGTKKLFWLQYVSSQDSIPEYWGPHQADGALLLGSSAGNYRGRGFLLRDSIKDPAAILERFRERPNTIPSFILNQINGAQEALEKCDANDSKALDLLVSALNTFINSSEKMEQTERTAFYSDGDFNVIQLSSHTQRMLQKQHELDNRNLKRLNRFVLEDVFAGAIEPLPQESGITPRTVPKTGLELTQDEKKEFKKYEKVIQNGWSNFIEVGRALASIRDKRLYRGEFHSFNEYCLVKLQFTRSTADRQICAAEFAGYLKEIGLEVPSESHLRPLYRLNKEEAQRAYQQAVEKAGNDPVTAKLVDEEAITIKPSATKPKKNTTPIASTLSTALNLIEQALNANDKKKPKDVAKLLEELRKCLTKTEREV